MPVPLISFVRPPILNVLLQGILNGTLPLGSHPVSLTCFASAQPENKVITRYMMLKLPSMDPFARPSLAAFRVPVTLASLVAVSYLASIFSAAFRDRTVRRPVKDSKATAFALE